MCAWIVDVCVDAGVNVTNYFAIFQKVFVNNSFVRVSSQFQQFVICFFPRIQFIRSPIAGCVSGCTYLRIDVGVKESGCLVSIRNNSQPQWA